MPGSAAAVHGAEPFDREVDIDLAGFGELERRLEVLAFFELLFQPDQHHVKAAGRERDAFPPA